ncbi:PA2779 family protein [Edaphobacter bradus]|uniref:PA2779 family protein n=1 Tax=Edaphobacter bradus TaxID=2259016 RepID=UPI0021DFEC50|nr:PA2779 family protein [Edaphobacter bradus]
MATTLVTVFAIPQNLFAQSSEHLVSPTELQKAVVDSSQKKQQNLDTLNQFFSSEKAQRALESAHQNPEQVKKAVAGLSDDELAQLASRANKAQADFAAGRIDDHDLLIILVCIAALVLVIVAVH